MSPARRWEPAEPEPERDDEVLHEFGTGDTRCSCGAPVVVGVEPTP